MCNAWNHSTGCTCGWGGDGHLGRRTTGNSYGTLSIYDVLSAYGGSIARERICTDSYVNPNARCPVCGARVFFYQSPYGGRVYFDELGWPWPKHPCTDNSQHYQPLTSSESASLDRLYITLGQASMAVWNEIESQSSSQLAPSAPPQPKKIDEEALIKCMEQGETAERNGDIHQAAMHFAEAINKDFRFARAWLALARVIADKDERAYCLTKALRVATNQDRIKIEVVKSELEQLKVYQLKHPQILWPTKLPAAQPQQRRPAKPMQPVRQPSKDAARIQQQHLAKTIQPVRQPSKNIEGATKWTLVVRIAKGGYRVQWHLLAAGKHLQGEVLFRGSPNMALLQALVKGLQEAAQLPGASDVELTVVSNYESVIKQARGETKIKNEQDRVLLEKIHSLKSKSGGLIFITKSSSDIEKYFES